MVSDLRVASRDRGRFVRGPVIDQNDLSRRQRLGENGLDRVLEVSGLVEAGDGNRDALNR